MDPLSISVSIITLIKAADDVISLCFKYVSAARGAARTISKIQEEIQCLRDVLESLQKLPESAVDTDQANLLRLKNLCDAEKGPIAKELIYLNEKLGLREWKCRDETRKAFLQSLTWPLREGETKRVLQNIERLKSTLELALIQDQTARITVMGEKQHRDFDCVDQSLRMLCRDQQRQKVLQWLSAPDPTVNFRAAGQKSYAGTGLWLLESQQFRDWKLAEGGFLWLHGTCGCGKTVLSATAVQNLLQKQPNSNVIYFYFDFGDSAKRSLGGMLRSLVAQLFLEHECIPDPPNALFKSCRDGQIPPQDQDLEAVLKSLVELHEKSFIVLDALDECDSRQDLLDFVGRVMNWNSSKLSVMMTSRSLKDFRDFFHRELRIGSVISIQEETVDEDIRLYIHGVLQSDRRFSRWQKNSDAQNEIENHLMEKCGGMFRWVACQIDMLGRCRSLRQLRHELDSLPQTLADTYDRILCDIDPFFKCEVRHVLQWLAFSRRPLTLDEVAEVVAFDVRNDYKFNKENRLAEPGEVLNLLSSLVVANDMEGNCSSLDTDGSSVASASTLETKATTVKLAHLTVKQYLVSNKIHEGPVAFFGMGEDDSNAVIGRTGLLCLHLCNDASPIDSEKFSRDFPLSVYSAVYWTDHLYPGHGKMHPLASELFLSPTKTRNWIALCDSDREFDTGETVGMIMFLATLSTSIAFVDDSVVSQKNTDEKSAEDQAPFQTTAVSQSSTERVAKPWAIRVNLLDMQNLYGTRPDLDLEIAAGRMLAVAFRRGEVDIEEFRPFSKLVGNIVSQSFGGFDDK